MPSVRLSSRNKTKLPYGDGYNDMANDRRTLPVQPQPYSYLSSRRDLRHCWGQPLQNNVSQAGRYYAYAFGPCAKWRAHSFLDTTIASPTRAAEQSVKEDGAGRWSEET